MFFSKEIYHRHFNFFSEIIIVIIPIMFFFIQTVFAQYGQTDSIGIKNLFQSANTALHKKLFDSALIYYQKAALLFHIKGSYGKEIECLNACGNILQKKRKFSEAEMFLDKSQNIGLKYSENKKELANTFHIKSLILYKKGEYNNAIFYEKQATEIWTKLYGENSYLTGKGYNNIGLFYKKTGQYTLALSNYKKALCIWHNVLDTLHPALASLYNNISIIYKIKGDYDEALNYCKKALTITLEKKPVNLIFLARKYNNLGIIYNAQGDTILAYRYYKKALAIRKKHYKNPNIELAESYNNLGKVFKDEKKYKNALNYYYKALTIRQKIYNGTHPDIALNYFNIASTYIDMGYFHKANLFNFKALKIWNEFYLQNHPDIALCYLNFEKIAVLQNDFKTALKNIAKAEKINKVNGVIQDEKIELMLLSEKALIYNRRYYTLSKNPEDLKKSLEAYKEISALTDKLRTSFKAINSMLLLSKSYSENFKKAVNISYVLYHLTKDKKFLNSAFYFAEKNRSSVLTEAILQSKSFRFSGILDSLIRRQDAMQNKLSLCDRELQKVRFTKTRRDRVQLKNLEHQKLKLEKEYKNLTDMFEENYLKYYRLKYDTKVITIPEVKHLLPQNGSLIEFLNHDSLLFTFVITKNNIVITKSISDSLNYYITKLRTALFNLNIYRINKKNIIDYQTVAYKLYKILILPVKSFLTGKEIFIIPDGEIGTIPFDVLLVKKPENAKYHLKKLPYLFNKYTICYGNSASVQFGLLSDFKCNANNNVLGIAPFTEKNVESYKYFQQDNERLRNLPASVIELKKINKIIGGKMLFGKMATKQQFINNASKYKVLHIATHGIINNKQPLKSTLIFYKTADSVNNKLCISELFNMHFHSELAVLSACNTGIGEYAKGEGIMSLARGFSYAGIPGITLSLWSADDNSSEKIMVRFYYYLKNGETKSHALHLAKMDYLKNSNNLFASPYYWGGYIFIGKNDAIDFNRNNNLYLFIGGFIAMLIVLFFLWRYLQ